MFVLSSVSTNQLHMYDLKYWRYQPRSTGTGTKNQGSQKHSQLLHTCEVSSKTRWPTHIMKKLMKHTVQKFCTKLTFWFHFSWTCNYFMYKTPPNQPPNLVKCRMLNHRHTSPIAWCCSWHFTALSGFICMTVKINDLCLGLFHGKVVNALANLWICHASAEKHHFPTAFPVRQLSGDLHVTFLVASSLLGFG